MAISVAVLHENASTANATTYDTTVSISPTAGRVLLVFTQLSGIGTATASTITGLSGTWTNVGGSFRFNTIQSLEVFTCTNYTGSGTLIIGNTDSATNCIWCIIEIDGADTTTPVVAGSFKTVSPGSVNSVSMTMNAPANSNNRAFVAFACNNNTSAQGAPVTDYVELSDRGIATPSAVLETQWDNTVFQTAAGVTWTGGPYFSGGIGVEIDAAAAATTSLPPPRRSQEDALIQM